MLKILKSKTDYGIKYESALIIRNQLFKAYCHQSPLHTKNPLVYALQNSMFVSPLLMLGTFRSLYVSALHKLTTATVILRTTAGIHDVDSGAYIHHITYSNTYINLRV